MTDKLSEVARAIGKAFHDKPESTGLANSREEFWSPEAKAAIEAMPWQELEEAQPEKWSFETLMLAADRLLASRYPETVFNATSKAVTQASGDCGARLVVALRDCRNAMADAALEGK